MRVKQAFYREEANDNHPAGPEWVILTAVYQKGSGYYLALPMTDASVFDHFEVRTLRSLPGTYKRVRIEDCPAYVDKWAKKELEP